MSDHFDHYKRPPSREGSMDRYSRAASRLASSRQPSVDKPLPPAAVETSSIGNRTSRPPSLARSTTPAPLAGNGAAVGAAAPSPQPPFEDVIIRRRGLGQDIVPSPLGQPKRTESLYIAAARKEPPPPKVKTRFHF